MTTIFSSDPHGTGKPWIDKVNRMITKYPGAKIVLGGDYIDGRKNSKETINYVQQLVNQRGAVALKGNHEDLCEQYLKDTIDRFGWFTNGAKTTIHSLLGRTYNESTAYKHLRHWELYDGTEFQKWLENLSMAYINGDAAFVHAYLAVDLYNDISQAIGFTDNTAKMWQRSFLMSKSYNMTDTAVVFGHTPTCLAERYDLKAYDKSVSSVEPCPILVCEKGKAPLIACDGGCHSDLLDHTGNVVVIKKEKIIDYQN